MLRKVASNSSFVNCQAPEQGETVPSDDDVILVAIERPGQFETVAKGDDNILVAVKSPEYGKTVPSDDNIIFDDIIFAGKPNIVAPAELTDEPADQNDGGADQPSPKSKQPNHFEIKVFLSFYKNTKKTTISSKLLVDY